jgi:hypothetical protein
MHYLALEQVMMALKFNIVRVSGNNSVLLEALFYCIPKKHYNFYVPDMDINCDAQVRDLIFDYRASLVDG